MMEKMNPVVTALRDDIRRRQQVVQHIASLEEQLDSDRICGAWLAAQGTLTASLRRIGTATYRMLVYDHTLCYRRLVQDAVVTLRRHRLLFGEETGLLISDELTRFNVPGDTVCRYQTDLKKMQGKTLTQKTSELSQSEVFSCMTAFEFPGKSIYLSLIHI